VLGSLSLSLQHATKHGNAIILMKPECVPVYPREDALSAVVIKRCPAPRTDTFCYRNYQHNERPAAIWVSLFIYLFFFFVFAIEKVQKKKTRQTGVELEHGNEFSSLRVKLKETSLI